MRSTSSTFGLLFGKHLPRAFGSWLITARPGPRARPRLRLASERRGGRSVSASVARGARDGFCCCAGRGVGPRRARCGVVPAFHTEGTHAAAPVLGRGPLPRVGLTTNQLEDRRWPTRTLSLYTLALRVFVQFQQFWHSSFLSWVLPFFVLVPRCIWAVACIWLTQFVGCNNFEFRNNLSGVTPAPSLPPARVGQSGPVPPP